MVLSSTLHTSDVDIHTYAWLTSKIYWLHVFLPTARTRRHVPTPGLFYYYYPCPHDLAQSVSARRGRERRGKHFANVYRAPNKALHIESTNQSLNH